MYKYSVSSMKNADNSMLVTVSSPATAEDDFISIRTYDKRIGSKGRFLVSAEELAKWFMHDWKHPFMDMDCSNIIRIARSGKYEWHFTIWWASGIYDGITASIREFTLTTREMTDLFVPGQTVRKAEMLAGDKAPSPTAPIYITASAHRNIAALTYTERTALKKFLRTAFRWWNSDGVTLCADGKKDFFFRESGGSAMCGGVILHGFKRRGHDGLRYEMHT